MDMKFETHAIKTVLKWMSVRVRTGCKLFLARKEAWVSEDEVRKEGDEFESEMVEDTETDCGKKPRPLMWRIKRRENYYARWGYTTCKEGRGKVR